MQGAEGGVLFMNNGNAMFESVAISDASAKVRVAGEADRVGGGLRRIGAMVRRCSGVHRLCAEGCRGVHR